MEQRQASQNTAPHKSDRGKEQTPSRHPSRPTPETFEKHRATHHTTPYPPPMPRERGKDEPAHVYP